MQNEDTGRLLRQTEERLQLALTVGRLANWDWQLPTGEMSWNDEHFRILGYEPGEVEPSYQAWADRVHPEDRPLIEAKFRQSLEHGGDYVEKKGS